MLSFLRSLPRPLVLAVVVALVARVALALGGDPLDPAWAALATLAAGFVGGLFTTDSAIAVWRSLDPKLVSTVVGAALTYLAVDVVGIAADDPLLQALIALVAGAAAGYRTSNAGTILRTEQETGNATPPDARPSQLP